MKKLIVNLAPCGVTPTRELTPNVPLTPEEIASDVLRCSELGVSMVHLHAYDADGKPAYNGDIYGRIIEGIRTERPDLIIVASTTGRIFNDFEKRSDVLNLEGGLKPDMASLTLGSMNFSRTTSLNSPDVIIRLIEKMRSKGIKPELEVFDLGMVNFAHYLIKKGYIDPPFYFNIIIGSISGAQARLLHIGAIVSELPEDSYWSLAGIGHCQKSMNAVGIIFGNGIRVGIEDNIWYDDERTVLATNSLLVERVVRLAALMDREIADPGEVRSMLNLP